jgi:hypothetical protein
MRESRTYGSGRGACDETRVPTATKAARVHHAAPRRGGGVAAGGKIPNGAGTCTSSSAIRSSSLIATTGSSRSLTSDELNGVKRWDGLRCGGRPFYWQPRASRAVCVLKKARSRGAYGDAAEMRFMECCRYLWKVDGVELIEPFILAVFNTLPEKSRCVLFQRMLTIVYLAQDGERLPTAPE